MPKRRQSIRHAEIVPLFAARLRQLRTAHGLTQAELGRRAVVTESYVSRLESGAAAPGIDLVERLARTLGTTVADLLPAAAPVDTTEHLRSQARQLCASLIPKANRETLQLLVPFLARLAET